MNVKLVLGMTFAAALWGQSISELQWKAEPLNAPGTNTTLAPAVLTALPIGFNQQVIATHSQRCTFTPVRNQTATSDCMSLAGDSRMLIRQGSQLTRSGDTLLASETRVSVNAIEMLLVSGVDLLEESNRTTPAIRSLFRIENPELTCTTQGNQATRTERSVIAFTFNEPLNVLYVLTTNSKMYYGLLTPPPGTTQPEATPFACPAPFTAASFGMPVIEDSTRTLIRISGPFPNAPAGLPASQ